MVSIISSFYIHTEMFEAQSKWRIFGYLLERFLRLCNSEVVAVRTPPAASAPASSEGVRWLSSCDWVDSCGNASISGSSVIPPTGTGIVGSGVGVGIMVGVIVAVGEDVWGSASASIWPNSLSIALNGLETPIAVFG